MIQKIRPPSNYRPDIDGLRAVAVLAVVMFHAFPTIAPGGFVGVDVFFVISGFLISRIIFSSLHEGKFRFRIFYAHRIKRIFPALIALLLGCLAIGWFVMMPDEYAQLGYHIAASCFFVENLALWNDVGYFDAAAELKPLLHLWSLAIEEQFYLFYPLFVWIVWKLRFNLLLLVLLLAAVSLVITITQHTQNPDAVFYLLPARFWELLAGGVIAYQNIWRRKWLSNARSIFGLLLITSVFVGAYSTSANKLLIEWFAAVTGACLLISADTNSWVNKQVLGNRLLVYIGLISYPLYLWHWPLLSFSRLLPFDHHISTMHKMAAIALSFVLAWITYEWIEKFFRYGKNSNAKTATLVCVLIVIGLLGVTIFKLEGLASRYPEQVTAVATYRYGKQYQQAYGMYNRCWFGETANPDAFTPECLGALASPTAKHTLLMWGDSQAAHIYPAIDDMFSGKQTVAEYARNACPPVIGTGSSYCIAGNNYVMETIKQHVPETVMLFAIWNNYSDRWDAGSPIAIQLLNTLHTLQSLGVKKIVLMGPAPKWIEPLPHLILKEMLNNVPRYQSSQRLSHGLDPNNEIIEKNLRTLVSREIGLQYFSTLDVLCNASGCLTRISDDPISFTSYDVAHLTPLGAQFVAKQLPLSINQQ